MLRLSVVVPTHGTRELTLRCVEALNAGVPGSSEVDDGSTDGTGEAPGDRPPAVKVLSLAPARDTAPTRLWLWSPRRSAKLGP